MKKALYGLFSIKSLKDKYLSLTILAVLTLFFAHGQSFTPIHNAQAIDYIAGIKYSGVPYGPTPVLNSTRAVPGAIFFNTTDSAFYGWTGTQWLKSSISVTSTNVPDSMTQDGTRYCWYKGGNATCFDLGKYIDSLPLNTNKTAILHYSNSIKLPDSTVLPHTNFFSSGRITVTNNVPNTGDVTVGWDSTGLAVYKAGTGIIIQNDTIHAVNREVDGVVQGGEVTWLHDYVYNISAATYVYNGIVYSSLSTDVTLSPADPTLDRIDAFVLTTSGTAVVVTGTPSLPSVAPATDPDTQLEISFAPVLHNTIAPPALTNAWIYLENTEWATTRSVSTITLASTSNPYAGTKDIEGTAVANGTYMTFTPGSVNTAIYQLLLFQIRSKANWQSSKRWKIQWYSGTTAIGKSVVFGSNSFGFISTNTTSYQTIAIPLAAFANISTATSLRITQVNSSGTIGWYLDNIQLQAAQGGGTPLRGVVSYAKNTGGDSSVLTLQDGSRYAVKDNSGLSSGGISQLGTGYGLTRINDSTYNVDSSVIATRARIVNELALKQNTITPGTTAQYFRGDFSLATIPTIPAQFNPIQGANVTITGTYPNQTFNATGGTSIKQELTATAGQTAFAFTVVPTTAAKYNIMRNGNVQPTTAYSVTGNTVTFISGLDLDDIVTIQGIN